jgi:hypothetical protein
MTQVGWDSRTWVAGRLCKRTQHRAYKKATRHHVPPATPDRRSRTPDRYNNGQPTAGSMKKQRSNKKRNRHEREDSESEAKSTKEIGSHRQDTGGELEAMYLLGLGEVEDSG